MLYKKILLTRSIMLNSQLSSVMVETSIEDVLEALRDNLVLSKAGARLLYGLEGDCQIAKIKDAAIVDWKSENGISSSTDITFDSKVMTPHRLTCYVDISDLLLVQSSVDIQNFIIDLIAKKMAEALQKAILGNEYDANSPRRIFHNIPDANKIVYSTIDRSLLMEAISRIDGKEIKGDISAIGNVLMKNTLRRTYEGGQSLLMKGKIDNYDFYVSNVSGGLFIGDFSQLIIGQWDKARVTVDTITQKNKGLTRITVNSYFDYLIVHPELICALYTQEEYDAALSDEPVIPDDPDTPDVDPAFDTTTWNDFLYGINQVYYWHNIDGAENPGDTIFIDIDILKRDSSNVVKLLYPLPGSDATYVDILPYRYKVVDTTDTQYWTDKILSIELTVNDGATSLNYSMTIYDGIGVSATLILDDNSSNRWRPYDQLGSVLHIVTGGSIWDFTHDYHNVLKITLKDGTNFQKEFDLIQSE